MNTVIYLASFGDFNDYKFLKLLCDFFTKNLNNNDIEFIAPMGGKSGDITCRNYIIKNNFKHTFLKPSQMDKPNVLMNCTHAILINNGESRGIDIHLKALPRFIKGKIVEVHTNKNEITIYQIGKEIISKKYFIENNILKLM